MTLGSHLILVAILAALALGALSLWNYIRRPGLGSPDIPQPSGDGTPDDEYGGLADYLQKAESGPAQAGYWLSAQAYGLLALITGGIVARWTGVLWWSHAKTPFDRVSVAASVALALLFGATLTYRIESDLKPTATQRYKFYGMAAVLLALSFLP